MEVIQATIKLAAGRAFFTRGSAVFGINNGLKMP